MRISEIGTIKSLHLQEGTKKALTIFGINFLAANISLSSTLKTEQIMTMRLYSKIVCFFTLFLIFMGGMVTSTGSGLSVPDWPLSYGTFFPPMVGGVVYEHSHRVVASIDGFLMLIFAVLLAVKERRVWIRNLGFVALGTVIMQGVLGGITVLFFLPTAISVSHGVLAQSYFIITILLAYGLSRERELRQQLSDTVIVSKHIWMTGGILCALIYVQLIIGAVMRHTHSGLAIPDFPTMGGYWIPPFNAQMLNQINIWRFYENLDLVNMPQIIVHFIHRVWALFILITVVILNLLVINGKTRDKLLLRTLMIIDGLVTLQIALGIATVLSLKMPLITTFHVAVGAATLGCSVLLLLRISPTSIKTLKHSYFS